MKSLIVNNFTKNDIERIAQLHSETLENGFIVTLGVGFLKIFYDALQKAPGSVLLAVVEEEKIVGFVSGSLKFKEIYKKMLVSHFFVLAIVIIRNLFSIKKIKCLAETILYPIKTKSSSNSNCHMAELLTLSVDKNYRRRGVAQYLCSELEKKFLDIGAISYRIMVGSELSKAQRFYESIGAEKKKEIIVHTGQTSYLYEKIIEE